MFTFYVTELANAHSDLPHGVNSKNKIVIMYRNKN